MFSLLRLLGVVGVCLAFENMNGEYKTTRTPNANGTVNTKFSEYPGGLEYFEVHLGPMTTLYSQVWWKSVPAISLPADLIKRFEGKGMAVVGYETDAVRKTPQGDVSVPINMAYNHHHDAYITGKHSKMEKVRYDPLDLTIPPMARSDPEFLTVPVETSPSPNGLPTSLHLADGNGGEYRKSYHGFPAPVAYVIDSPQSVYCNPMFIDTWNRDEMNISGGSKFVAGPLPKHSLAPANASYSGLLECPLTDRIQKILPGGNAGFNSSFPPTLFQCTSSNATVGPCELCTPGCVATFANKINLVAKLSSPTAMTFTSPAGGGLTYTWTRATAGTSCVGKWSDGGDNTVTVTKGGISKDTAPTSPWYPAKCDYGGTPAPPQSCAHLITSAEACFAAAKRAVGNTTAVETAQGASNSMASGCTVTYGSTTTKAFFNTKQTAQCCGADVTTLKGRTASLVLLDMSVTNGTTTITLTGPADVWFGTGFFAQAMEDKPYAIIVDGAGGVTERVLASHMGSAASPAGSLLKPSVKIVSTTVTSGKRTVVLTRPSIGASAQHASFSMLDLTIPFINAIGSSSTLTYHVHKTASSISLWPAGGQQVCVCEQPAAPFGSAKGNIRYLPTGEEFGFVNGCSPEPRESILAAHNPTCDVRAYAGGLQVCKHMWSLLDADQEQPWPDQPLVYYQKYRFYFQEYQPQLHVIAHPRAVWAIGAFIGEYDVPQCKPGTPTSECKHEIWGVVTPGGDNLHMAAMHFHCHAPTCLAMEIWNNHTGELLCRQEPIYGGTGKIDIAKFDETGYISQPPCLWGEEPGLEKMPLASGVAFTIKAITNSTVGHHGEMAFPEIALVPWNTATNKPQAGTPYKEAVKTEWRLLDFNGQAGGR